MEIDHGIVWEIPSLQESKNLKKTGHYQDCSAVAKQRFPPCCSGNLNCLLNFCNVEYFLFVTLL